MAERMMPTHSELVIRIIERWPDIVDMCPMFVQDNLRDMPFEVGSIQRMLVDAISAVVVADLYAIEYRMRQEGKIS